MCRVARLAVTQELLVPYVRQSQRSGDEIDICSCISKVCDERFRR